MHAQPTPDAAMPTRARTLALVAACAALVFAPRVAAAQFEAPAPPLAVHRVAGLDVGVHGDLNGFTLGWTTRRLADDVEIATITLRRADAAPPPRFSLKWRIPSHDMMGNWASGRGLNKTIRPDWAGSRLHTSMFSQQAPVMTLFTNDGTNVLTFALSDALNTIVMGTGVREEDGWSYNEVSFFTEPHKRLSEYTTELRIDRRRVPYFTALDDVSGWWARLPGYAPTTAPEGAKTPVYSTWYNYHQSVESGELLRELAIAKPMGMGIIIVDDGWQTLDTRRGYAFTGDWEPQRMPNMRAFVDSAHKLGVKVMLWYAVPFVGKNSKAAARFKDKALRFDERLGTYVVDPRYPEVRRYLIDTYARAIRDWGIDGFKLDFIERFAADQTTVLTAENGRDYASVNEATDRMMTDIMSELRRMKPDVMVEFRQAYIGPLIRKYGNMLRASDSPNNYVGNRVKIVDVRLLSGTTPVHADMVMWHPTEPPEIAAFQLNNVLFSVPQVSVKLGASSPAHREMIRHYLEYWKANRELLIGGRFEAFQPNANYPMVVGYDSQKQIVGLYEDLVVRLDAHRPRGKIDVVNGKSTPTVVISVPDGLGTYRYTVTDCRGRIVRRGVTRLSRGLHEFEVPVSGILALESGGP
ncbi:MAG TPA: glycoside hydrolase family 36 protein [Gemmatimonadaceae bacterium]|nr:glycoside hydrolase family 36 protein [Gemmatimonadaceae bacterium]